MDVMKPLIINLACTGVIPTKAMNRHVPIQHNEIVDDVAQCLELGVQMVHLHARDEEGVQTGDPEPYGRLVETIRKLPGGREAILCVTTSGRKSPGFEERSRILDLSGDAKPDMASLTLSSLNFVQSASVNAPDTIQKLAERMHERGIRPELEIFDVGMANYAKVLIARGILRPPFYANVLLGNIAGAQPAAIDVAAIQAALPDNCLTSYAGIGRFQLMSNTLALMYADGVRVGLEDNLWMDEGRTVPASNVALIKRILALAETFERPLMSRLALRELLDLPMPSATSPESRSTDALAV